MKTILRFMSVALCLATTLLAQPALAQAGPKTLVVYDAPPDNEFSKLGMA